MICIWWNVERLFAYPESQLANTFGINRSTGWTREAYDRKIHNVASVLNNITGGHPPALLGLGEVENDKVIDDLIGILGWTDLIQQSDPNELVIGYDIELLFNKKIFKSTGVATTHSVHKKFSTREVFVVNLEKKSGEGNITIILTHWASRLWSNSIGLRIGLADYCERLIDDIHKFNREEMVTAIGSPRMPARSLIKEKWNTPTLIMGDFNDNPYDMSISEILHAQRTKNQIKRSPRFPKGRGVKAINSYLQMTYKLYNPCWRLLTDPDGPQGTSRYDGRWHLLDQILLSRGLLGGSKISFVHDSLKIYSQEYVQGIDGSSVKLTTKVGNPKKFNLKRKEGVSDHLPIVWNLETS